MIEGALPAGWQSATLGQLRRDGTASIDPRQHPDEYFELYSIPSFPIGRPETVVGRDIGSAKLLLTPGTVVLSKINPRINRVWVVASHTDHRKIGSSEWIPFSPIAGLRPEYLAYLLRQHSFRDYLAANVSGVGGSLMRVRPRVVDPFSVAVAPSPEQYRIVSALDSYFSRLDAAEAALQRVEANLKRYRASVLKAAVEGRLVPTEAELARRERRDYEPATALLDRILVERRRKWEEAELAKMIAKGKPPANDKWKAKYKEPTPPDTDGLPELPEGWCWASIEQIESGDRRCAYGVLVPGPEVSDGVRLVRVGDVRDGVVDESSLKRISPAIADKFSKTYLRGGEVLVSLVGTIGRTAVVPLSLAGANVARAVGVLPVSPLVAFRYVEVWLRSPRIRAELSGRAHEVARKTLNLEDVRSATVALAPAHEQRRLVAEVDRLGSVGLALAGQIAASSSHTASLRQSILKWAFEGRLVDQDPTDEPASVLLERIRAEREAADAKPNAKRATRKRKAKS